MHAATPFVLSAVLMAAGAAPVSPTGANKPVWHTDVAAAQEQARRENRPIFAVLHCGH